MRYSQLLKVDWVRPSVVLDGLAELQVHWPNVPIVFCENRSLAEEWTYRFLAAAHVWAETESLAVERIEEVMRIERAVDQVADRPLDRRTATFPCLSPKSGRGRCRKVCLWRTAVP